MNLGLGRQMIGLEIRDAELRAVLCRKMWGRIRTVDTLAIPNVDSVSTGEIARQFRSWREGIGAGAAGVSLVLPRERMVCRSLMVPMSPDSDLRTVLGLQVEFLHPYEGEEVYWDYSAGESEALSTRPGETLRKVTARVVVARRGAARELIEWLQRCGIAVSRLTAAVETASEMALSPELTAAYTLLGFSDGAHLELVGAGAKRGGALPTASLLVQRELSPTDVAAQIAQAVESLQSQGLEPAGSLTLAMSGSITQGGEWWTALKSELAQTLPIVELGENAVAEAAARAALATSTDAGFNLLSAAERHDEPTINLAPTFALAGVVIVLAVLLGVQGTLQDLRLNGRLEEELAALQPRIAVISAQQDRLSRTHERLLFLKSVRESARVPLDVMEEVSQRLPNEAWLQQLQLDGKTATFSGSAGSASEVLQALSGATRLESPQFLSAILRGGDGQESYRIGARLRQSLK